MFPNFLYIKKTNFEIVTKYYLVFFLFFILVICSIHIPRPIGEWDDYFMPTVTLTSHKPHISVYQADIEHAATMFPQWAELIRNDMHFSPYKTNNDNGGMIPWYFPTYAIACIPLVILLPVSHKIYAFAFTNFIVFALLLLIMYKKLKYKLATKNLFFLFILVTLNPIIFYFNWISAEVFIYSTFGIALTFWYCKEWKKTAFFISLAGSLNPVIMIVGIAVIGDYFYRIIWKSKYSTFNEFVTLNLRKTFIFGCCFIYSLLPFLYAKIATGKFNILISGNKKNSLSNMFSYFLAYFFDLNYGFLPYYNLVFLCFIVLVIIGLVKRKWHFVFMSGTFFALVFAYCKQFHINCGISGIARYNAWAALIFLFSFIFYLEKYAGKYARIIQKTCIIITTILQLFIVITFSPILAKNVPYTYFTPIAEFFLDNVPFLYNPLYSTFYNRTVHIDDDWNEPPCPIIYSDKNGYIRKILASRKDIEKLNEISSEKLTDESWFKKQIDSLTDKNSYISIPKQINLRIYPIIYDSLQFYGKNENASVYASCGLSSPETYHTWTDGKLVRFNWRHMEKYKGKIIHVKFNLIGVYHAPQQVSIKVNGLKVFSKRINETEFEFDYQIPDNRKISLEIELPNAISPANCHESDDKRMLSLGLRSVELTPKDN